MITQSNQGVTSLRLIQDFGSGIEVISCMKMNFKKSIIGLVLINVGCQMANYKTNQNDIERIRLHHSREILMSNPQSYKKLKKFDNERKIRKSIEAYIESKNSKLDAEEIAEALIQVSYDYHYDPMFILSVITTESQFNPSTVGKAGEIGLMQIKPDTAEWIMKKYKKPWKGRAALFDPVYNIQVGALYFKYLKKTLKSDSKLYINAYNVGINNLSRYPASATVHYPYYKKVVGNYLTIYNKMSR